MKQYNINKGIGRTVEFKGLKAQYLFLFAGGLLSILLLTMILYLAGTIPTCASLQVAGVRQVSYGKPFHSTASTVSTD